VSDLLVPAVLMSRRKATKNAKSEGRKALNKEAFFNEVDERNYAEFSEEESFIDLLATIHRNANLLQKALKPGGKDQLDFKVMFPFRQFCACISRCHFDRERDVQFRYCTI
jgi:hypothetical protein